MRLGGFYQGLYAMLGGATAIFTLLSGTAMTILSINASKSLFKDAAQQVMFSPMRFFDTTPTGRILGIFGKDIDAIDNELPELMRLLVLLVAMVSHLHC